MTTLRLVLPLRWRMTLKSGLQIGLPVLALLLVSWWLNLFGGARLALSNVYFVADEPSSQIVIIALDDASLQAYGRSLTAWDRQLYADLLDRLSAGGARAVAFDLLFAEPSDSDAVLAAAIERVRASDTRTRVVLAAVGAGLPMTIDTADSTPVLQFATGLYPVTALAAAADYTGYVNTVIDLDGMIRRQSSLVRVDAGAGADPALGFALAAYLAYLRIPAAAVPQLVIPDPADPGVLQVTPERRLMVDAGGFWLQNFVGAPGAIFPTFSMRAVLEGEVDPAEFTDKLVLVGLFDSRGATDLYFVPSGISGRQMSGVEIQAHAVQTLLSNNAPLEQSPLAQLLMLTLLAPGASLLYVRVRWTLKFGLMGVLLLVFFVLASVNFSLRHEMVNLFHGSLAIILPALVGTGVEITTEVRRRQQTELLLDSVVEVARQQMAVDRILRRIAEDMERIIPLQGGSIWLLQRDEPVIHTFGADQDWQPLIMPVRASAGEVIQGRLFALPVRWQGRTIAVIAGQTRAARGPDPAALRLLHDLAQDIAPGLENAVLHAETERQKQLLQAILDGSPALIAILDEHYVLRRANPVFYRQIIAATALAAGDQAEAGETARKSVDDDTQPYGFRVGLFKLLDSMQVEAVHLQQLRQLMERGKPFQTSLEIAKVTFNVYAALLPGYRLWVLVLSDVTALAELNNLKTRMIRMASHDLKNPLSSVLGYAHLLQLDEDQFSQEQQRFVRNIESSAQTMLTIINDLLNLEQLRSTRMPEERLSLSRLVYEVVSRHEPEMTLNRQQFRLEVARNLPEMIGKPTQLAQVISNLLGNAIKYTPREGTITLRCYHIEPDTLRLEVQDTGVGIAPEAQGKLFTEFYRVRTAATAGIPGTGLGLSLVKAVVDEHLGRIWLESEENVGSTFFVEFPVAPTDAGTEEYRAPVPA